MLALEVHRQSHCSGCGQPLSESTHIDNDGQYRAEDYRCFGCAAIAHGSKKYREDDAASAVRYKVSLRRR
jgi:hypothetical protein